MKEKFQRRGNGEISIDAESNRSGRLVAEIRRRNGDSGRSRSGNT